MATLKNKTNILADISNSVFPNLTNRLPIKSLTRLATKDIEHYLYEDANRGFCTACRSEFTISSMDKHKSVRRCPICNKKVTVQRRNGRRSITQYGSVAYPEISGNYLVMRYFRYFVEFTNEQNGTASIKEDFREVGRIVYTNKAYYRFVYDFSEDAWEKVSNSLYATGADCFHPLTGGMWKVNPNPRFVLNSYIYAPSFIKACERFLNSYTKGYINEYASRRYRDLFDLNGNKKDYYCQFFEDFMVNKADQITEKFLKEGKESILDHYCKRDYNGDLDYVGKLIQKRFRPDRSVLDILNLTKSEFSMFGGDISYLEDFVYLKKNGIGCSRDNLKKVISLRAYRSNMRKYKLEKKVVKIANYIKKAEISCSEYFHYLYLLEKANMTINDYLFPKDFRKTEKDVLDTIDAINALKREKELERDKQMAKSKNGIINAISTALLNMKDIDRYLGGSNGLLVKVPETAEELVEEGSRLHNCLRTYIDKVARGDCLIFFIRRADRPDEPFYAMEYCNGEINQLYADHNEHDSNYDVVYTFCSDFIKILNDLKVDTKSLAKAVA